MKISEFRKLIREEVYKSLKETEDKEDSMQEAFFPVPTPDAMQVLQHLGEFSGAGVMAAIAALYVILMSGVGAIIFGALGKDVYNRLSVKLKQFMQDYKDKKQINPAQIKAFHDEIMTNINQLSPGKQKFIKSLINKIERTNVADKNTLLQLQRNVTQAMKQYQTQLNKSK